MLRLKLIHASKKGPRKHQMNMHFLTYSQTEVLPMQLNNLLTDDTGRFILYISLFWGNDSASVPETLQWRYNERYGVKSPASRLFSEPFV